jgi:glycosyltransferase involved in cell wall biosynthesis
MTLLNERKSDSGCVDAIYGVNQPRLVEASDAAADRVSNEKRLQGTLQRRVKLCFLSPLGYGLYRPESGYVYGGAELQLYLLSQELSLDPELDVVVLTTVEEEPGREQCGRVTLMKRRAQHRLAHSRGGGTPRMFRAIQGYLAALFEMFRLLRAIDADVYVHAGAGVEVGAYAMICRLLGRRFVYVVASSADVDTPHGKIQGVLRWLFPVGLRLAHAIVCRTREQQRSLQTRYGRSSTLIRTGHPVRMDENKNRHAVLWVGRIHPLKRPHLFLDLAEHLSAERCVMVAMHDAHHADLWHSIRKRASTLPNVLLHENVPWKDMLGIFARAKLSVNTSTYEGFPNTFVEAAMQGVPTLSLAVNPDEVLTAHHIGCCAGGSFDRLVGDAKRLCTSEGQRMEYARRARAYAQDEHDICRSAGELKTLVKSLLLSPTTKFETT